MKSKIKILIDNGHGIDTLGKNSPDKSLLEYKWARMFAKRLEDELLKLGLDVERVVKEEKDISITKRVQRINTICALWGRSNVLLISIHNNAGVEGDAKTFVSKDKYGTWKSSYGWSVFVSKNASASSKRMAQYLTDEAISFGVMGNRHIPAEKYWTWSWTKSDIGILKNSYCPAVLTENMFQDNRQDVAFLLSEEGIKILLQIHINAVKRYLGI